MSYGFSHRGRLPLRALFLFLVSGFWFLGSLPISAIVDTNDNGVSDFWEKQFNDGELFPESFDPQADSDADGWTNAQEAAAGTNPFDSNPPDGIIRPDIVNSPAVMGEDEWGSYVVTPAAVTVSWPTLAGKQYTLLFSADLTADSWIPVGNPFVGSGSVVTYGFPTRSDDKFFWRVGACDIDTDGDGLTDHEEHLIGSSPYFADTDDDGTDDAAAYAAGLPPAGGDADSDGVPDNAIYSVEFEVQEEWKQLFPGLGVKPLTGDTSQKRYLTSTHTDEYSIANSPRYTNIASGLHKATVTWLSDGVLTTDVEPVTTEEGTSHEDWMAQHPVALSEGESITWSTTATTTSSPTITADEQFTTTAKTTPWTVKKGGSVIRSGTEIITTTDRIKLTDGVSYPQLWANHFQPRAFDPAEPIQYGPPMISAANLQYVSNKAAAAESTRESYRNGSFAVSGNISVAGGTHTYYDLCLAARLKSIRWRWVRFDPLDPFSRHPAQPPESIRKRFTFLISHYDGEGTVQPLTYSSSFEPQSSGMVTLECAGNQGGSDWQEMDLAPFNAFRQESPATLDSTTFAHWSRSDVWFGILPAFIQKRIPNIADEGGPTTYAYRTVDSVPREVPLPGVEITGKTIHEDQITLTAKLYDALSDVTGSVPSIWVNSRQQAPAAGDKPGVFRLQGYNYKLFPGRNEITVAVEDALGGRGSETVVVEGDSDQGYQIVGTPVRNPVQPTYPLVLQVQSLHENLPEDSSFSLALGEGLMELPEGTDNSDIPDYWFRSKPILSILKPASATPARISELPAGKPLFFADLTDDLSIRIESSQWSNPADWTVNQAGVELVPSKTVEIQETGSLAPNLQIKARGLGRSPAILAMLTTYRDDEAELNVTAAVASAYQAAYGNLAANAKNDVMTFTVNGFDFKEGYNNLTFDFANSTLVRHGGSYQSFRFPSPTKSGVRVFSANRKMDVVTEGVTSRPQDSWYPVAADADLSALAEALMSSGCEVVGMLHVNGMFDDSPLKRSFLVRGPPGRTFPAFDQLYAAQGRTQRSQTFDTEGTHGASLAGELDRVQTDAELPASARNALGLEIAKTYQFHNGFEDFVPKTHQAFVDPGNGVPQPNSWTMRGSSLPDHQQSNPSPWIVTNTLGDPERAASTSGIVKIDTTAENAAYYATTSTTAPWDLTGARAVSLRFKLISHDSANGADGAFQLAAGDAVRTWTCQIAPDQVKVQGIVIVLPITKFPDGLIDGNFHTLQFNFSGTGNDALVSLDGEVLTATAVAQPGTLNGIAFGDPGADIAGKFEIETLGFENSDLRYQYGIYDADDYADSDEIDGANNILLYLRSKGQAFRTSAVARWVKILDPKVYEWLLGKYTGKRWDGVQQELHVLANKDVWLGSTVGVSESPEYASRWPWAKKTKVTNTLVLDKEETKVWSTDQTRNDMQLAGILMAWVYEQGPYKVWLAEEEGGGTGIDGILNEKKHLVDNIAKCADRVATTLEVGGEIVISITNEYVDYAITINNVRQGDYMAMVGFIPLVPSSTARAFKFINKIDGTLIEGLDRMIAKFPDFQSQKVLRHQDANDIIRDLEVRNLFADHTDSVAVEKLRKLATNQKMSLYGPGEKGGYELLSTFSNQAVICYKTKETTKAYRVFDSSRGGRKESNFLLLEPPISKAQAESDYALGSIKFGSFQPNYDSWIEIEIPQGSYVFTGVAAKMDGKWEGGGRQVWIEDDVVNGGGMDWANAVVNNLLPQ